MPMPEACVEANRVSQAIDSTVQPKSLQERLTYKAFVRRDDIPVRASPSLEFEWIALSLSVGVVEYADAPSRVSAIWLRKLRQKKVLRDKFWAESWSYYMENRLSLELRAEVKAPAKRKGAASKSDDLVQSSIERMSPKKTGQAETPNLGQAIG
jgi:hypothetical protein